MAFKRLQDAKAFYPQEACGIKSPEHMGVRTGQTAVTARGLLSCTTAILSKPSKYMHISPFGLTLHGWVRSKGAAAIRQGRFSSCLCILQLLNLAKYRKLKS